MSPQLSLGYKPAYVGAEAWQKQLEVLRAAVRHLGLKEVSFELDVSGSMLSDSLNERDRKRWAAEWTQVVIAMLSQRRDEIGMDLCEQLCGTSIACAPYRLDEETPKTDAQLAAEALSALEAMGEEGKRKARKIRGIRK